MPSPMKKGDPPICTVCNQLIPRQPDEENNRWLQRKVCNPSTDYKAVKCIQLKNRANNPNGRFTKASKNGPHQTRFTKAYQFKQIDDNEAFRLDMEQMAINLEIERNLQRKCGYHNSEVRILTPAEIAQVADKYSPPEPGAFLPHVIRGRTYEHFPY